MRASRLLLDGAHDQHDDASHQRGATHDRQNDGGDGILPGRLFQLLALAHECRPTSRRWRLRKLGIDCCGAPIHDAQVVAKDAGPPRRRGPRPPA